MLGVHYCGNTVFYIHKLIGMRLPRQLATAAVRAGVKVSVLCCRCFVFLKKKTPPQKSASREQERVEALMLTKAKIPSIYVRVTQNHHRAALKKL